MLVCGCLLVSFPPSILLTDRVTSRRKKELSQTVVLREGTKVLVVAGDSMSIYQGSRPHLPPLQKGAYRYYAVLLLRHQPC